MSGEGDSVGDPSPHEWLDILGGLMLEPYLLRAAEVAQLTPFQTFAIYYRPRDKEGRPIPTERSLVNTDDPEVQKRMWFQIGRSVIKGGKANFTEAELAAVWEEGERRRLAKAAGQTE